MSKRGLPATAIRTGAAAAAMLATWALLVLAFTPVALAADDGGSPLPRASAVASPLYLGVGLAPNGLGLGAPVARAQVGGAPPSAAAAAGLVGINQGPEDAATEPGLLGVKSTNPGQRATGTKRAELLGSLGPYATAETPSPRVARSRAGLTGELLVPLIAVDAASEVQFDDADRALARVVSEVPSLRLFDLDVRGMRSEITVESAAGLPPLVSYTLVILELRLGPREVVGGAGGGIVLRGDRIPLPALPEQFGRELERLGGDLGGLGRLPRIRLVQPNVTSARDGLTTVTGPVLEVQVGLGEQTSLVTLRLLATAVSAVAKGAPGSAVGSQPGPSIVPAPISVPATSAPARSSPMAAPTAAPSSSAAAATGPRPKVPPRRRPGGSAAGAGGRLLPIVVFAAAGLNALLLVGRAGARMARDGTS